MMKTMGMYHGIELKSRKFNIWGTTSSIENRRIIPVRNKQPVSFSLHR
jgi:hypothetical protein